MGGKAAKMEVLWEVRPTAHYCMGGIRATPAMGRRFAPMALRSGWPLLRRDKPSAGSTEAIASGSTSLAEGTIFRAPCWQCRRSPRALGRGQPTPTALQLAASVPRSERRRRSPQRSCEKLQRAAWEHLGPARTADGLALHGRRHAPAARSRARGLRPPRRSALEPAAPRLARGTTTCSSSLRAIQASAEARDHTLGSHIFDSTEQPEPRDVFSLCTSLPEGRAPRNPPTSASAPRFARSVQGARCPTREDCRAEGSTPSCRAWRGTDFFSAPTSESRNRAPTEGTTP